MPKIRLASQDLLVFALLAVVTLLAYANSFKMDFIGDDVARILFQKEVFSAGYLETLRDIIPDRPILMTSLWLNSAVLGFSPFSFKVVNLLLHFLCGCAVFILLLNLLKN